MTTSGEGETMIEMTYTVAGIRQQFRFPDDRLDELLARCDARFLPAWSAQDDIKFRAILAADEKRRERKR